MNAPLSTQRAGWLRRSVFTTDHRSIGRQYLFLSLVAVATGTLLSLAMRIHLVWPELALPIWGVIKPEDYLALVTMHGTMMVFFVLTTAPQFGFGNLIAPAQIGAQRMAFPLVNAASFWLTAVAFVVLVSATLVAGGAPISGWTSYPPFSAIASAGPGQAMGMDLWLVSIGIFCIASMLSSVNMLTTIIRHRCAGLTWLRVPLTVWSWFTASLLIVLVFSVLLVAIVLLISDRHFGSSYFVPPGTLVNGTQHIGGNGSPLLWLHLFWFFGHPEVYIAVLPGMGLTSMLLANFSRRRVSGYRTMIVTTLLIGLLGILVWGHHMFVAGLNPFAGTVFAISTIAIAIPSTAKVLSWIATLWRARPHLTTPMLFSLGFVSLFITGGLTGPILAQPILDAYLHNTFFVVAHFHLIMGMAGAFSLFAATYYWFPQIAGCMMSERLGKLHFWWTIIGAYSTFLPMHAAGLAGEPRHYAQLTGIAGPAGTLLAGVLPLQRFITAAAICLAAGQFIFIANLLISLKRRAEPVANPWRATTLEWVPERDEPLTVWRSPCEYSESGDPIPQWAEFAGPE